MSSYLSGYFDETAETFVRKAFLDRGIEVFTSEQVLSASRTARGRPLTLASGKTLMSDFFLVATGVQFRTDYLAGSGVEAFEGILVDERMRTSAKDIWAAGDVTQTRGFFDETLRVNPILPSAVEQGRIAGMDMVDDPMGKAFPGTISLNTFKFFSHRAFSIGMALEEEGMEVDKLCLPEPYEYVKLVYRGDHLVGAMGIDTNLDPGVMHQLIRRKVPLGKARAKLMECPLDASRVLMTSVWR